MDKLQETTSKTRQEVDKEMDNCEEPKLAEKSFQHLSSTENSEKSHEEANIGPEHQNVVTANTGVPIRTMTQEDNGKIHSSDGLSDCSTGSVRPINLVLSENDHFKRDLGENLSAKLYANLFEDNRTRNVDRNKPSTSKEVPDKSVPLALLCSALKISPTAQSYDKNKYKYPQMRYRFTPIANDDENDNLLIPPNQIPLAGAPGIYMPYPGRAAYPARNTGNIDLENTFLLSNTQYNRSGNENRRIGLKNTGSTCYINSVMQVLLATHKFSSFTVTKMYVYPFWAVLAELFGTMMFTVHPVMNPRRHYTQFNSLHFNIFQDNDVSEFFIYLIEMLRSFEPNWDKDWSDDARPSTSSAARDNAEAGCSYHAAEVKSKKRPKIIGLDGSRKYFVNNVFGGVVATSVLCHGCGNTTLRYEMLHILHLSIPDAMYDGVLTIQRLIDNYFASETLSGVNRYMCNVCQRNQNAQKSSIVVNTPKYLVLTLKNFSYDAKLRLASKKKTKVHCEETITLHSTTKQKDRSVYELYALIVHDGQSLKTGHYSAMTKYHNQWYLINDTEVYNINYDDINHLKIDQTPYMLFYRRSDMKEGGFPEYGKIPWFSRCADNERAAPGDN